MAIMECRKVLIQPDFANSSSVVELRIRDLFQNNILDYFPPEIAPITLVLSCLRPCFTLARSTRTSRFT